MAKLVLTTTIATFLVGAGIPDHREDPTPLPDLATVIFSPAYRVSGTYVDLALIDLLPEIPQYIPPPPPVEEIEVTEPKVVERPTYVRTTGGYPTESQWASLRMCESTDNPRAISPQGWYRGLYQFDLQTWGSVGGTGDPIDAPRDEQDYRAKLLYDSRGRSPWPVCGRYLN